MIESIKKQGNGWLVNGNKSVPNDVHNTDCKEVLAYLEDGGSIEPESTEAELTTNAENEARSIRNSALTECDWTQNRDVVLANDGEWQAYRQELRDVTSDMGWMTDPINTVSSIILNKPS